MSKILLIDGHADILYRMDKEGLDFNKDKDELHLSYDRIREAGVDVQFFALFVGPPYSPAENLTKVLAMIDDFYNRVCANNQMRPLLNKSDLAKNLELGVPSGLLSIEGGDCLQGDIRILRRMHHLGVRAMGLTWNNGNSIAAGVGEPVDTGLTEFGFQVVREMNELGMIVDVSHLSERGFWQVNELCDGPFIASHSNARALMDHPRNLTDEQLKAVFAKNGVVGLTYVPMFIADKEHVEISDLLRHLDHMLSLGGENHVGLGSDFDGIDRKVVNLEHGGQYHNLIDAILKAYGDEIARKICGGNFKRVLEAVLKD